MVLLGMHLDWLKMHEVPGHTIEHIQIRLHYLVWIVGVVSKVISQNV